MHDFPMASKLAEKAPAWVYAVLLLEFAEIKAETKEANAKLDCIINKLDQVEQTA